MYYREEEKVEQSNLSEIMSDTDNKTVKVPSSTRNYVKADEVKERGGDVTPKPQDSRMYFCRYCGKGFKSCNALSGHMRIHSQNHVNSKTRVHNIKLAEREHSSEEEDDGFGCFSCKESFSTMKLLVQHMTVHRGTGSNVVHRPTISQECSGSNKVVKQGIQTTLSDFFNVNSSQSGKTGLKRTAGDDDVIYEAESSRGPETKVKNNRNKSNPRTSMKKRSKVERVHRCDICDKIFATGQALGGHKTKHRIKDALKLDSVQQELRCNVMNITRNLFPGLSPEEADHDHPKTKRVLDFDLNIPYQE